MFKRPNKIEKKSGNRQKRFSMTAKRGASGTFVFSSLSMNDYHK